VTDDDDDDDDDDASQSDVTAGHFQHLLQANMGSCTTTKLVRDISHFQLGVVS